MSYVKEVLSGLAERHGEQAEFLQAVHEVLESIEMVVDSDPSYRKEAVLERLVEPNRQIVFAVPWVDDSGQMRVNRGYRVQFSNAIGPYKGGIRFHPSVNLGIIKFLGFEQIFKNSLTGMPIGGGKGGSDFDPKGKSDREVLAFATSFITELYKYVGADVDVPAGDIGVGAREIGYMYGAFKRITGRFEGVLTGKPLTYGGSLARKEATGFGLVYLLDAMLKDQGMALKGKRVVISGSGNVAIYAAQKVTELGARVIAMSDSGGFVHHSAGIDLDTIKQIKEQRRGRISEYAAAFPQAEYVAGGRIWQVECDIALPCATQNELDHADALSLIKGKVIAVAEGANMPCTPAAVEALQSSGVLYAPGKAANAGGVATSALEMTQNSMRLSWTFEEVDAKLHAIMNNIYRQISTCAREFGKPNNLVVGANIAGFIKVANALISQGM